MLESLEDTPEMEASVSATRDEGFLVSRELDARGGVRQVILLPLGLDLGDLFFEHEIPHSQHEVFARRYQFERIWGRVEDQLLDQASVSVETVCLKSLQHVKHFNLAV